MNRQRAKQETRYHQAHPNAGKSYHPRRMFRSLKVPYQSGPGQKYLHPERRRKTVRV